MKETRVTVITIVLISAACAYILAPFEGKPLDKEIQKIFKLNLGIDLNGGAEVVYRVYTPKDQKIDEKQVQDNADIIMKRINSSGLKEPRINVNKPDKIQIQIAGIDFEEWRKYKGLIERMGKLELIECADEDVYKMYNEQRGNVSIDYEKYSKPEKGGFEGPFTFDGFVLLKKKPIVTGDHVKDAYPSPGGRLMSTGWEVDFQLDLVGGKQFEEATDRLYRKQGRIAIVLDRKIEVMPVVQSKISTHGQITGGYSQDEANKLAVILKTGSLKYPLGKDDPECKDPETPGFRRGVPEQEAIVGPTLGQDAIQRGLWAVISSTLAVTVFMIVYYRSLGFIAVIGMLLNMLYLLVIMALLGATLTLPGIGGITLTIGMAVDANILIAERIREEQEGGKTAAQAFERAYNRVFVTIMDCHVTTLIATMVLYFLGTGPIRGFAVTLAVGILTTLITVLWACKHFTRAMLQAGWVTEFKMMQLFKRPNIDFIRLTRLCVGLSLVTSAISVALLVGWGQKALGADFIGGSSISIHVSRPLRIDDVRARVRAKDAPKYDDAEVQIMTTVIGAKLSQVTTITRTEADQFQIRTGFQDVPEIKADLQFIFWDEMDPQMFDVPRTKIRDLPVQAVFGIGVKPDKLDPQAFVKWIRASAGAAGVDDPTVETERDASADGYARFNIRVASKDEAKARAKLDAMQKTILDTRGAHPEFVLRDPPLDAPDRRVYDRAINASLAVYVKTEKLDAAAYVKLLKDTAQPLVDKNTDGLPYITVKADGARGPWSKFLIQIAARDEHQAASQMGLVQEQLLTEVKKSHPEHVYPASPFISEGQIGPAVAQELRNSTFWALIISWFLMIIYIWIRFYSIKFGGAAVIALIHDAIISLGAVMIMFMIVPKELGLNFELSMSTVASILTIIGYSVNDTIVVYDRIRENIFLMKKATFAEIINASVNQMLGRTVLTSLTAWISVVCLYVFTMTSSSGASGLAFPMIVGFIVGTYSSIYIAAPILVWWYRGERPAFESK